MTANPIIPPMKHQRWILAYPAIPTETRRPAMAMVISVMTNTPLCVPNQAYPPPGQVHPSVAHSGSNSCTARMLP